MNKVFILKGHEGPITQVKFRNTMLYSSSKDKKIICWSNNGEKIRTYDYGKGAVTDIDVNDKYLVSGGSDCMCKIWYLENDSLIDSLSFSSIVCSVALFNDKLLVVQDNKFKAQPTIYIYKINDNKSVKLEKSLFIEDNKTKINKTIWIDENTIACGLADGMFVLWNVDEENILNKVKLYDEQINDIIYNKNINMITIVSENGSILFLEKEQLTLENKQLTLNRPINTISISSQYILCGGGDDPMQIAATSGKKNEFDVFIYDYDLNKVGSVSGHFGPINAIDFSEDGNCYATGSQDGTIRLYNKINNKDYPLVVTSNNKYIPTKNPIPEDLPYVKTERRKEKNTLYVSNLPYDSTEDDMHNLFGSAGDIKRIYKQDSKNFAFVTYYKYDDAVRAVDIYNNMGYGYLIMKVILSDSK